MPVLSHHTRIARNLLTVSPSYTRLLFQQQRQFQSGGGWWTFRKDKKVISKNIMEEVVGYKRT